MILGEGPERHYSRYLHKNDAVIQDQQRKRSVGERRSILIMKPPPFTPQIK